MKKYILLAVLPLIALSSPLQIKGYQYQGLISDLVNEKKNKYWRNKENIKF